MNRTAVASLHLKPSLFVRPPAPGHQVRDAQKSSAGRPYPRTAVATIHLVPWIPMRPPAPGQKAFDAHHADAGRPSSRLRG